MSRLTEASTLVKYAINNYRICGTKKPRTSPPIKMHLPQNSNENVPSVYTQHDVLNVSLEWNTDSEIITKLWPFVHFPQAILRPTTALAPFPRPIRQINQTDNESRVCEQAKCSDVWGTRHLMKPPLQSHNDLMKDSVMSPQRGRPSTEPCTREKGKRKNKRR